MKVIFLGTHQLAVPSLTAISRHHQVLLVATQPALIDGLAEGGQGDTAGGLGEDAFGLCQQANGSHGFLVGDTKDGAVTGARLLDGVATVGRRPDRE